MSSKSIAIKINMFCLGVLVGTIITVFFANMYWSRQYEMAAQNGRDEVRSEIVKLLNQDEKTNMLIQCLESNERYGVYLKDLEDCK